MTLYLSLGKWITPQVWGRRPPPSSLFTFLSLPENRGILYGGINPDTYWSDAIYIATITGYQLVSL